MNALAAISHRARRALLPPPRLPLSAWIEQNIRLADGMSHAPGALRLWPFQREIADANMVTRH